MEESWKQFRERCELEYLAKQNIIEELSNWAHEYKLKITTTEPLNKISEGKFIALNELENKLKSM